MEKHQERKYKDRYVNVKDIYKSVKNDLTKKLTYSEFYGIVKAFFEELIVELVENKATVRLPAGMGKLYIKKKEHRRAFHYRCNVNERDENGKKVVYKVPILDDYYYKLVWLRPKKLKTAKIMPMGFFKRAIKEELNKGNDF